MRLIVLSPVDTRAPIRRRHVFLRIVWLCCFFAALTPGASRAQDKGSLNDQIKGQKKELDKIQREMNLHRDKSKELRAEEQNLLKKISSLEKDAALSTKLMRGAQNQENLLAQKIDSLKTRIVIEEEKLSYQRERLRARVRQLYMEEPNFKWAMLLGSEDLQEMVRNQKFLRLIAGRDAKLFSEVKGYKLSLETEQVELTETLVDVADVRKMREQENVNLSKTRSERLTMLKRVKNEKGKHEQALEELKQAEEKLKKLLDTLEKSRLDDGFDIANAVDFATLKGKLGRPVEGSIVKKFGQNRHPKFGTVTFNSGVDISAAPGAPISAVARGKVEFVDWIAGYGQCLIVNHGKGYYTLYAHVSDVFVQPAQVVSAGEVIAEVGDTGSMEGYVCHFEIRKSKEALDPMEWFAQ
jgi:septal ring factor EnvC (AmiA/AmiB activator)